jgi:hypothetical protein
MKTADYVPILFVQRTNLGNKTFHDRLNLGVTVSPRPDERQPGHHYVLVKFPWASEPIDCNLRVLAIAS